MMSIFIAVASLMLGLIIGYGFWRIISIRRSIRALEFEYYWRTKGKDVIAAFERASYAAHKLGVSFNGAVKLFGQIKWENMIARSDVTTKVRVGNLDGIIDTDLGVSPSGVGLYIKNVYLKGSKE